MVIVDTMQIEQSNTFSNEMIRRIISDSTTLIVLVMKMENVMDEYKDIREFWFNLIKEYDTDLSRTICVFTNCDNVPRNFNYNKLREYLKDNNSVFKLKYGYICCKLNLSSSIAASDINHFEKEYFNSHKIFQFYNINDNFTVETLGERITKFICSSYQFNKSINFLYQKLNERITTNEKELRKFVNEYIDFSSANKDLYLQSMINIFCETIDKIFSGKAEYEGDNLVNTNLKKEYVEFLTGYINLHPSKNCKNDDIIKVIQQSEGTLLSGFPSSDVIYSILDTEIEQIRIEVKRFLDNVYLIVNDLFKELISRIFGRFPKALNKIEELIIGFVDLEFAKAKKIILNISEMNFNYLYIDEKSTAYQEMIKNTLLKDVCNEMNLQQQRQKKLNNNINNRNSMNNNIHNSNQNINSENNQTNVQIFKKESDISFFKSTKDKNSYYKSLSEYVKVLVDYTYAEMIRCLREYLPKTTGNYYINSLKNNMRFYLISYLSKNPQFTENLEEDKEQAEKRKYYLESTKKLKNISKQITYDDSLMKIIKGDNMKSINDIVNAKIKIDNNKLKKDDPPMSIPEKKEKQSSSKENLFSKKKESNSGANSAKDIINQSKNSPPKENKESQNKQSSISSLLKNKESNQNENSNINMNNENNKMNNKNIPPQNTNQIDKSNNNNKGMNVNLKFDPNTNQVKDVKIEGKIDINTVKKIYDNNKQYLPTGEQMWNATKKTYNFISGAISESMKQSNSNNNNNDNSNSNPPQKSQSSLSYLFGINKKPNNPSTSPQKKRGMF